MAFEALQPRESAVEACARALRRAIIGGELLPGARLPPERRLAEAFGVNRVTVRGALAELASRRLLSVRQGSGYVVRDFRRSGGPDLIAGIAELAAESGGLDAVVRDLLAVRRALARSVLERVREAAGPEDRAAVAQAVERFAEAVQTGEEAKIAAADLEVLAALLDATHSAVFGLFFNPVMSVVSGIPALRRSMYAEPDTNVAGYQVLLAWMQAPEVPVEVLVAELQRRDAVTVRRLREER